MEIVILRMYRRKNLGRPCAAGTLRDGLPTDPSTFWCPATALGFLGPNADSQGSAIQPLLAFNETRTSRILQSRVCVTVLWLL